MTDRSEQYKLRRKQRRQARIKQGICGRCERRRASEGYSTCEVCRAYFHKKSRRGLAKRVNDCRRRSRSIAKAAIEYVSALREVERVTPSSNKKIGDKPELMFEKRKAVQSAVRNLFAAVETRRTRTTE